VSGGWTKGAWEQCDPGAYSDFDGDSVVILGDDRRICVVQGSHSEAIANAALIAEAGTVANKTGVTPRQLADQRAELLVPVLTPVREVVTPDFYLHATPAEWAAKMRARYGDDWEMQS
jgi:hypothetical protein